MNRYPYLRQVPLETSKKQPKRSSHHTLLSLLVLAICAFAVFKIAGSHVSAAGPKITSGISGYCLDDHKDTIANNAVVDDWKCNDTAAQVWDISGDAITHEGKYCLTASNDSSSQSGTVSLDSCDDSPQQVWLRTSGGFENPNIDMCLSAVSSSPNDQLITASCSNLSKSSEVWSPTTLSSSCKGSEGAVVACYAEKEWTNWNSGTVSHETLLNQYTDGAPYEEWCADFVSYVYKEAGYPFTQGEANGWDESNANYVQNENFTLHQASSGYIPQPGDVAFFNYSGGHVEIVVSGGKNPTFVYGNSGVNDPSTGNGQMAANTILNDGQQGQIQYYLTPN